MHELGIMRQIIRVVDNVVIKNHIKKVKYIALDIGEASGVVPAYMHKVFPMAKDLYPVLKATKLIMNIVPDDGILIKEIGY